MIALGILTVVTPRYWLLSSVAFAVALLVVMPLLVHYWSVASTYHTTRTYVETLSFSAHPVDWLTVVPALRIYG